MKNENKPRLIPEHFKTGKFSGSPRDFTKGKISLPRGGEDVLEYWYSEDLDESEYLDEDFQENVDHRIERLKKEGWDPNTQVFLATTQSHLDLGWRWRFRQGIAKAERTFSKVHRHFKFFAPFTFTGSQPAMYNWVKYNSPNIWKEVIEDVKSGRHELQGGCWSEADGRMPSGEAWVRQRLYGQLFYAKNFGKIANISWFPDSFGYADNLPQFFGKSGANGFMTSKLVSNKQTKWPFWAWIWESPDGTQLLSYLSGNHSKLGPLGGFDVSQQDSDIKESYVNSYRLLNPGTDLILNYEVDKPENNENVSNEQLPIIGCFFGEGDGGHGPQGVEVAVFRGYAERGYVKWASTKEIFDEIRKYEDRLPIWKDELYYQFHRASLTTQTAMKRMNRFFEWNLPIAESLFAIASLLDENVLDSIPIYHNFYNDELDQIPTAKNLIEQIWQNVLLMQFHDVLPGTSLPEVYDECYEFWHQDLPILKKFINKSMETISKSLNLKTYTQTIGKEPINENIKSKITFKPILISNPMGSINSELIEINKESFENLGLIPFAYIVNDLDNKSYQLNNIKPIQLIDSDKYSFDLDKKPDRYVFSNNMSPWSFSLIWIIAAIKNNHPEEITALTNYQIRTEVTRLQSQFEVENSSSISIHDSKSNIDLIGKNLIASIDKNTGYLCKLNYDDNEILKKPAGLHAYLNTPKKEPCWNLMEDYWKNPKNIFKNPPTIEIIENGPVKWSIRVNRETDKSKVYIDYSMEMETEGLRIDIGFDFHEIETFIKYEFPFNIDSDYTIAETPYSTSLRKNNPSANHDIPRWEKWMHSFVTMENSNNNMGIAVINEGKYGFDTLNQSLGISIIQGALYPDVNVVAWVKDERKERSKKGLGQPPLYSDQGESLARLWVLPYNDTWKNGNIHNASHSFNSPKPTLILENEEEFVETSNLLDVMIDKIRNTTEKHDILNPLIKTNSKNIEVTILKNAEILPEFMNSNNKKINNDNINDNVKNNHGDLIVRVVNNVNSKNHAILEINKLLLQNFDCIYEVDLLECKIEEGIYISGKNMNIIEMDSFRIAVDFNPHEIKTFRIHKK